MNDWRLTEQAEFLGGATFERKRWNPREGDDHDHCEFCWAKFAEPHPAEPDPVQIGYSAAGPPHDPQPNRYWVCEKCFEDFREQLRFEVCTGPIGHSLCQ